MKTVTAILLALALPLVPHLIAEEPWKMHVIDAASGIDHLSGADGVRSGDINGDGYLDFVTGWEEGKSIRITLNPGPERVREPWKATTISRVSSPEDAVFADLDGDGLLDVISATEGKDRSVYVHWCPAEKDLITESDAWTTEAFPTLQNSQWWMYSLPIDVDRDGDLDLIVGSKNAGASLTWMENPGPDSARNLSAWETHRLFDVGWIMSLRILERDEARYLIFSDRKGLHSGIHLLPLLDEAPWFGKPVCVAAPGEEVMFLDLAFLDDDDRLDIVAAIRPDRIAVFYQPEEPLAAWVDIADLSSIPTEVYGTAKAVRVGDLDGDSIPDFAITCERADGKKRGVFWSNVFSEFHPISDTTGVKYDRIELLDLDADGDLDLITCEERAGLGVIWFENPLK